jgi:hypothetical protein
MPQAAVRIETPEGRYFASRRYLATIAASICLSLTGCLVLWLQNPGDVVAQGEMACPAETVQRASLLGGSNNADAIEAGYEACDVGGWYRHAAVTCYAHFAPAGCFSDGPATSPHVPCSVDSECVRISNGYCSGQSGNSVGCRCVYPCQADDDCGPGGACLCAANLGDAGDSWLDLGATECVSAECRTNDDCEYGGCRISPVPGPRTSGILGLFCDQPNDECRRNEDCSPETGFPQLCAFDIENRFWRCAPVPDLGE